MTGRFLSLAGFVLFGLLASMYSPRAAAATYDQAMASCQAYMGSQAYRDNFVTGNSSQYYSNMRCAVGPAASGTGCTAQTVCMRFTDSRNPSYQASGSTFPFTGSAPPPVNPCQQAWPATTINTSGKVTAGSSTCSGAVPDGGGTGGTVQCALSINPESPPTVDPQTGNWSTWVTVGASGNTCGASNTDVTDGNGDKINPTPFIPTLPPTTVTPPPSLCTGGSCYDPKADQYCGSSGGVQFCVPGSSARTSAGACSSTSSATMCAGSPNAPKAPADKVPDPATEIKSSDKFTQADKATGQVIPVNVVVWATSGTPTNGAKAGDSAPAPASTAPSPDKGMASGGQTCNSPPVCTGDAPTCAAVSQVWLTRCGSSLADKNSNGQPDWTETTSADSDVYSTATVDPGQVFKTAVVDGSGVSEQSFAGNTCPSFDAGTGWISSFVPDSLLFCRWLAIIRAIVIFMGGVSAALILAKES